jgi:hypothetical protein
VTIVFFNFITIGGVTADFQVIVQDKAPHNRAAAR